ncbi:RNA-directed DNA polymerase, eukaryota, reverse transcriptase zinc-binding domain protein [Tanacetum coccineum]
MLDSYTSTMCLESWGCISYARALIEINSEQVLKDDLVVAIPLLNILGYTKETVSIEYEWQPPRCESCKIFGHSDDQCPKKKSTKSNANDASTSQDVNLIRLENAFNALRNYSDDVTKHEDPKQVQQDASSSSKLGKDSDSEDVEDIYVKNNKYMEAEIVTSEPEGENTLINVVYNSHVATSRLEQLCSKVFWNWKWTSNGALCVKGSRIILGWNPDEVYIMILSQSSQVMHTQVIFKADRKVLFCSFIYAHNRYTQRRELWQNLDRHKLFVRGKPWCLMGDFNSALNLEDKVASSSIIDISMREFKECVENIKVSDVNKSGLHFTWNQKPKGEGGLLKKIDRVMANLDFNDEFVGANALFHPYRISDHSPAILRVVEDTWKVDISGFKMFCVVKKLKLLKKPLRKLLYNKGNLHERVKSLRNELDELQRALDLDPSNLVLREEEAIYLQSFNDALLNEERFLKQKAKVV